MGAPSATAMYATTRDASATRESGAPVTLPRGSFVQWSGALEQDGRARVELAPVDGGGLATLEPSALQLVVTSTGDRSSVSPALVAIGLGAALVAWIVKEHFE